MTNIDTGCLLHAGCAIVSRLPVSYGCCVLYIRLFNVLNLYTMGEPLRRSFKAPTHCSLFHTGYGFQPPSFLMLWTYTDASAFQCKLTTCVACEDPFNKKKDHLLAATIDKVQSGGYKYVLLLSPKHLPTDRLYPSSQLLPEHQKLTQAHMFGQDDDDLADVESDIKRWWAILLHPNVVSDA